MISYAYDVQDSFWKSGERHFCLLCLDKAGNRIRKTDAQGEIRYLYNEKNQLIAEESPADRKTVFLRPSGRYNRRKNLG